MAGRISLARKDIQEAIQPAPLALVGGTSSTTAQVAARGDAAPSPVAPVDELLAAWETNPRCLECGRPVDSVTHAALLVGPLRVAHRDGCFVPALLRVNPQLRLMSSNEHPSVLPLNTVGDREPHRG